MPLLGNNQSPLLAPGSNFGLGRVQPTREQGLSQLGLMADLSPAGDAIAMGQGLLNRDPLGFGLGLGSLLIPGTIKPQAFDPVVQAVKRKMFKSNAIKSFENMKRGDFLAISPDRKRKMIDILSKKLEKRPKDKYPATHKETTTLINAVENHGKFEFRDFNPETKRVLIRHGDGMDFFHVDVDDLEPWDL